MTDLSNILDYSIKGFVLKEFLIALGVFLIVLVILKIFREVILSKLRKAAKRTKTDFDDVLIKIVSGVKPPFYFLISLYFALKYLTLSGFFEKIVDGLFILAIAFQVAKALEQLINYGAEKFVKGKGEVEPKDKRQIQTISLILKIILWTFILLVVLSNFNVNITSLIAGLGIGGIAVAFALQNILSDIFSSFSIYFDKPFVEGDFIAVGDDLGTVQKIGIKSTRLKTSQGEELVISNKELTETRVHNYKKMEKRRGKFVIGIAYETPAEKLKKIPLIVKEIIDDIDLAEPDRIHFKEFGDFSLNFEIVYYVSTPEYKKYMDIQQEINLAIKEKMEKEGIKFAYPTYTIHMDHPENK